MSAPGAGGISRLLVGPRDQKSALSAGVLDYFLFENSAFWRGFELFWFFFFNLTHYGSWDSRPEKPPWLG